MGRVARVERVERVNTEIWEMKTDTTAAAADNTNPD